MLCVGWAEPYDITALQLCRGFLPSLTLVEDSAVSLMRSETSPESSLKQRNVLFSHLQLFDPRGVRPRLEGKPRTPLPSRVATRVSWSPLSARRGSQGASRAAPGKSGLHARGEGERVHSWKQLIKCHPKKNISSIFIGLLLNI